MSAGNFESFDTVSTRLRVIASCDHCRSRKIKCVTDASQADCSACLRHNAQCTYNARTKYYADRERQVASRIASGGVSTMSSSLAGGSSIISFSPATVPVAATPSQAPRTPRSLFEATHPEFPQVALMPYFIELFFKYHAQSFPFISYEYVVSGFLHSTLTPIKSNMIACIASKYSAEMPELAGVDPSAAPETYANQAKRLLQSTGNAPSVDTLSSLVVVAFYEHVSGRRDGLKYYAQQATYMLQSMQLHDDAVLRSMSHSMEEYQSLIGLRATIQQLYGVAAQR